MLPFVMLGFIAGIISIPPASSIRAQSLNPVKSEDNKEIHIKANKVIADLETGETEFIGDVRVSQGQTIVTADRMKVYYRDLNTNKKNRAIRESIYKVIANGNVKIHFEDMIALTDEAVWMVKSELLTLTGINSRVISGANSISGYKFVLSQSKGSLIVESSSRDQVEAVFFTGGKSVF
jgi:lipopolysaccharide export system protein LptA